MKKIFWPRFKDEIIAFTSTRGEGVSKAPFASLNLAYHVGDDFANVANNRKNLFSECGFTKENTVIVHQFHSDISLEVTAKVAGRGYDSFESGLEADALFTREKGLALGIYHADCVPVFLYVPRLELVGVVHAGQPGSLSNITGKMVAKILSQYDVTGADIYAFIGPSLKFGHRRITKVAALDILKQHPDYNFAVKGVDPEYFLDLPFLNFMQLVDLGIPSQNIDLYDDCTYENADDFFSYARDKTTGRMMSFIVKR